LQILHKIRNLLQLLIEKSRNLYYLEKINSVHGNMNLINETTGRKKKNYIPINRIRREINNTIINETFEIANK